MEWLREKDLRTSLFKLKSALAAEKYKTIKTIKNKECKIIFLVFLSRLIFAFSHRLFIVFVSPLKNVTRTDICVCKLADFWAEKRPTFFWT